MVVAKYTQDSHITTAEEVTDFFRHIVYDLNINFHPNDDFKDYVSMETGERMIDNVQASLYNRLMDEAFEVCGDAVYEISAQLLRERMETK